MSETVATNSPTSKPLNLNLITRTGEEARPMTGNEAIARGVWEAGCTVAAAYPGTPSTEILENLAKYPSEDIHAQWSTNEKVALDVAFGASYGGVRAFCAMKHVGLNVAADALLTEAYIGVNGGMVLAVCDDPGIHSSQNEQDTRLFGRLANVPVLEPSDAQEALDYTRWAFELSEKFDTPIIVRSTTRVAHTRSPVVVGERLDIEARGFADLPNKNIALPMTARLRHPIVIERERLMEEYFSESPKTEWISGNPDVGVITAGIAYSYVREVLPNVNILKLPASFPLARNAIRQFCDSVKRIIIVEELEPFLETEIAAMGYSVEGKVFFPRAGELSPEVVHEGFAKAGLLEPKITGNPISIDELVRPPVLCSGCPHTGGYMALRALNARVAGDIGCYTLAAMQPLQAMDTCVSMGSSIGTAVGLSKAGNETRPIVATIGDSTFLHGGITGLIDAVYNNANITVLLLNNSTTAMTGGQDHPGTGKTLRGEETHKVNYADVCRAVGVPSVKEVDSYDLGVLYQAVREATEYKGVAVVIANRPCVLDPVKIKGPAFQIRADGCTACQSCMNLGCPALSWSDEMLDGHHKIKIDETSCIGCTLCVQICPSDCIRPAEELRVQ
jgi:indolepyruvate ferredoxin oxidoreductase alpha subunit